SSHWHQTTPARPSALAVLGLLVHPRRPLNVLADSEPGWIEPQSTELDKHRRARMGTTSRSRARPRASRRRVRRPHPHPPPSCFLLSLSMTIHIRRSTDSRSKIYILRSTLHQTRGRTMTRPTSIIHSSDAGHVSNGRASPAWARARSPSTPFDAALTRALPLDAYQAGLSSFNALLVIKPCAIAKNPQPAYNLNSCPQFRN
ncbi:hypothetical protein C8R46DRAFT_501917, partial [Mycena filopes]